MSGLAQTLSSLALSLCIEFVSCQKCICFPFLIKTMYTFRNTTREAMKKIKHCYLCQGWRLCDCPFIWLLPKSFKKLLNCLAMLWIWEWLWPLVFRSVFLALNVVRRLFHLHTHTNAKLQAENNASFVSHKHICVLSHPHRYCEHFP